jgi:hypothetical protein
VVFLPLEFNYWILILRIGIYCPHVVFGKYLFILLIFLHPAVPLIDYKTLKNQELELNHKASE